MTERQGTPLLTPTYNTVLITSILDIVKALNAGHFQSALECIETLWVISPKCVREDCKKDYDKFHAKLREILNKQGVDAIHSLQLQNREARHFIATQVRPLLQKIRDSLDSGNYLEKSNQIIPLYKSEHIRTEDDTKEPKP